MYGSNVCCPCAASTANLGGFLSEDDGTFTIKLDSKMMRGQASSATLTDSEPDKSPIVTKYSCTLNASAGIGEHCGELDDCKGNEGIVGCSASGSNETNLDSCKVLCDFSTHTCMKNVNVN